jgi:hypothetical protein
VAFHRRAPAPGQEPEALVEQAGDLGRAESGHPGGGQLDGQRDAVQPPADFRHRRQGQRVEPEVAVHRGGPLREQPHRIRPHGLLNVGSGPRGGQGPDSQHLLPADPQRLAAGGQDSHRRAVAQDVGHELADGVEDMLAVVQNQQQLFGGQHLAHPRPQTDTGVGLHGEGGGDDLDHGLGVGGRRQLAQPHPLGELRQQTGRALHGQAGLGHPAHPGQGDLTGIS